MVRWAVWQGVAATLHAYCRAVDSGDVDGFVDLYMPDGIHDDGIRRRVGQAEIHSLVAGVIQRYDATSHHLSNIEVTTTASPDEVLARSHIYAWHRKAGQPDLEVWGQYQDRLCRSGGVWRFRERMLHVAGLHGLDRDPGFRRLARAGPTAG
jgi:ketosteroid isomerase-like protein